MRRSIFSFTLVTVLVLSLNLLSILGCNVFVEVSDADVAGRWSYGRSDENGKLKDGALGMWIIQQSPGTDSLGTEIKIMWCSGYLEYVGTVSGNDIIFKVEGEGERWKGTVSGNEMLLIRHDDAAQGHYWKAIRTNNACAEI